MHYRKLNEFFTARRVRGQSLALATVYETRGSTYSKPGACMLIDENGIFQGMLSGGCLEGDLAIRAQQVIESGEPQVASYDLSDDNDELWGLGVGCDGLMRVLLQPLNDRQDYQPFVALMEVLGGTQSGVMVTVIRSTANDVAVGASFLQTREQIQSFGLSDAMLERMSAEYDGLLLRQDSAQKEFGVAGGDLAVFGSVLCPIPRVLVLGAGLDAEPVVSFAAELGWRCTVIDHRPAYIDNNNFAGAEQTLCCPADQIADHLDLELYDMAVVMSHHIVSDRAYLRQLADTTIAYIGLLGPANRKQRLISEVGNAAAKLAGRLHGPAGLDVGGRGPAAIALSITAEMQQHLAKRQFIDSAGRSGSSE